MICGNIKGFQGVALSTCLGGNMKLQPFTIDIIKGFTRASVVAMVLLIAAELDVETEWELLLPFTAFLDRAWLLPCHVTWFT